MLYKALERCFLTPSIPLLCPLDMVKKSQFFKGMSAWPFVMTGLFVICFSAGLAWFMSRPAEEPVSVTELFSAPSGSPVSSSSIAFEPAHEAEAVPSQTTALASAGIGMSWMRELWKSDSSSLLDTSLDDFLERKKNMEEPDYSEPVVWEKDPRYTLEESGCGKQLFRSKVRSGDHIGRLFRPWLDKSEVESAINAVSSVFKVNRLRPGRLFSVERNSSDEVVTRLMYEIDEDRHLVVRRTDEGFKASVEVYDFVTKLVRVKGRVTTSLFEAMCETGEESALAGQLSDVFSHQINFVNEVREGDEFEVVVEKKYLSGKFRRYGDIVAARFINAGREYEAFRFFDDDGAAHYYAADGSSLETQFLKAPLNFTRISSRYSMHRKHPVFGKVRPHQGIDYAAPRGTPVKALGDGTVTFVGWKPGYGKSVAVRHGGGIETHYAHLSRYIKNLKKGDKVEQGQVIAFVGATGTATGPHLDFRVKKNGKFIDPLKLSGGRSASIASEKRELFEKQVEQARLLLKGDIIASVQ